MPNEPNGMKRTTIFSKYVVGDIVYMKVKRECDRGMVTALTLRDNDSVTYGVTFESTGGESTCQECELTTEFIPDFQNQEE